MKYPSLPLGSRESMMTRKFMTFHSQRKGNHLLIRTSSQIQAPPKFIFPSVKPTKQDSNLLPPKLDVLEKIFHALECTVTFMSSRDQQIIFHKIQKAVENMCNKYVLTHSANF